MSVNRSVRDQASAGLTSHPRPASPPRSTGPLLWLATMAIGLMAGLFYAFSIAVMPGLANADDRTSVLTMQKINQEIENAAFATTFFGGFVFTGAAAFLQYRAGRKAAARWVVAALALYVTALLITMGINVPLNERLASVGHPDMVRDLAAVRADFEGPWVTANIVRTLACMLALGCLARALALHGRAGRG